MYIRVKVDDLGRVTLPIDLRRMLDIRVHDKLLLTFNEETGAIELIKREKCEAVKKINEVKELIDDGRRLSGIERETLLELLDKLGGTY
jgi:bifunctional DNA-binding transcriptional regulator/antitoxin component of YhaV-PrlF toxin-antitoxin module